MLILHFLEKRSCFKMQMRTVIPSTCCNNSKIVLSHLQFPKKEMLGKVQLLKERHSQLEGPASLTSDVALSGSGYGCCRTA